MMYPVSDIAQLLFELQCASNVFKRVESDDIRETHINQAYGSLLQRAHDVIEEQYNKEKLEFINRYRVKYNLEPLESL